ncbi:MAG: flagellar hook protein FlgE [Bryobacteraceae bacterium]
MFTSFSTALSGLNANSTAIDVVGNNLANLNTTGFKTSQVEFQSLVTQSLGAGLGETQVGFGTGEPLTTMEFTQGAVQTSGGAMDAAIQGDGFFVVNDSSGNSLYTRAGNFEVDKSGNLMTDTGDYVQGWTTTNPTTGAVSTNGPISNIVVPVGSLSPPVPTTTLSVGLNLNSSATVYSATDTSSDFSTPMTVYDSLGTSHVLTLDFQKTGSNTWNYNVTIPGADVGSTDTSVSVATGSLTFDSDGQLDPANASPVDLTVSGLADGASDMSLQWSLFNGSSGNLTQFGQPSAQSSSSQNGSAASELVNVGLGNGGTILAQYSDGNQVTVGQVAMASIVNPDSLIAVGNNNFQLSSQTATPSIGLPGTGGRGDISGGSLEASTVDIATEFTNLMVYQRAYEADSRVVTTADTLSQDTINLIH